MGRAAPAPVAERRHVFSAFAGGNRGKSKHKLLCREYHVRQTMQIVLLLLALAMTPALALDKDAPQQQQPLLGERISDLKGELRELNRELAMLEEELLFPTSTQLAVFLSLEVDDYFELAAVKLSVDDKLIASHVYNPREQAALRRGGVQRLYLGNLKSGEHELLAEFNGPGASNGSYAHVKKITFSKSEASKFIELKILDQSGNRQPEFVVREWE